MENQLYIRIRGKILGPYDQEKLQSLSRRGQLSRLHEVSQDAANWVRASTYPELFLVEALPGAGAQEPVGEVRMAPFSPGASVPSGRGWWYRKDGCETGPVDQATLQQLVASGNVGRDDLVWTDGMGQWIPAQQAPGLVPPQGPSWPQAAQTEPVASTAERRGNLPVSLCKAAANSHSWVVFVAIVSFVYAGLVILGGILSLIYGARNHWPPVVAGGLFNLIFGIDVSIGGLLLSNYANRVASLRYSAVPVVLEKALDSLRTCWIYLAINLIVALAFMIVVAVWVIAIGGAGPLWNP